MPQVSKEKKCWISGDLCGGRVENLELWGDLLGKLSEGSVSQWCGEQRWVQAGGFPATCLFSRGRALSKLTRCPRHPREKERGRGCDGHGMHRHSRAKEQVRAVMALDVPTRWERKRGCDGDGVLLRDHLVYWKGCPMGVLHNGAASGAGCRQESFPHHVILSWGSRAEQAPTRPTTSPGEEAGPWQ